MKFRSKLMPAAVLSGLMAAVALAGAPAEDPIPIPLRAPGAQPDAQPDPNALPEGSEVLARGPVHEAFATTSQAPAAAPVVAKQPPDPIEELPPDQKPEGENVQWIPGYWHWDDDGAQFMWISGFWRDPPPGRLWVPGSWREVQGGWQWVSGFWQAPSVEQPLQPEIQYLTTPPATLEVGPSIEAPTTTSFYVPGSWVWRHKYVWRPGVWIEYRPNWVWVPAHYCRTPVGFVFVEGYWDYPLARRGVLYAPVTFTPAVYTRRGFVYTPLYVVSEPALVGAMFVRRGYGNYYFGNYFEARYVTAGYNPWAGRVTNTTFAIGFGTGRTWGYDPLWSYYSVTYRNDRVWNARVNDLYVGRYSGKVDRPPVSLRQQNTVINNISNTNVTNVTNNITVVNNAVTVNKQNVTDIAMLAPAKAARDLQPEAKIRPITAEVRKTEAVAAKQTRDVGVQRNKMETAAAVVVAKQPDAKPADQPRTLKLDVPKETITRTVIKDEKKAPPPPAHAAHKVDPPKIDPKVEPKLKIDPMPNPKVDPKIDPKTKIDPKVEPKPKVDPMPNPKIDPKPKVDPLPNPKPKDPIPAPKPKVDPPKIDPKPKVDPPKVDPKLPPATPPKVDPKPPVPVPPPVPKVDPPKVEPKLPPVTPPPPKVEPKLPPVTPPPKVDPPKLPPVVPPTPKVDPPKIEPKLPPVTPPPKVEPKPPAPKVDPKLPPAPKVEPKKNPPAQ